MENVAERRKINRRTTRTKTQVIHFDRSELDNLRSSNQTNPTCCIPSVTVGSILNQDYEQPFNTTGSSDNCPQETVTHCPQNTYKGEYKEIKYQSSPLRQPISSPCKVKLSTQNDENSNEGTINNKVQTERMFSFNALSDYFKKVEKRELFPKSRHDYIYKKAKTETENASNMDILEEKNIIYMRVEEELIPGLQNNPFIQADKRFNKK